MFCEAISRTESTRGTISGGIGARHEVVPLRPIGGFQEDGDDVVGWSLDGVASRYRESSKER